MSEESCGTRHGGVFAHRREIHAEIRARAVAAEEELGSVPAKVWVERGGTLNARPQPKRGCIEHFWEENQNEQDPKAPGADLDGGDEPHRRRGGREGDVAVGGLTGIRIERDNRAALIEQFGEEIAVMIDARFAKLLMSKVGPHDQVGHCLGDRLAIVSHDVDLKQGERFGKQVCRSLASGQITIRGQKVKLTASVGVASTSDDKASSGMELFTLADQRLNQALVCGGNTVAIEFKSDCPMHCRDKQTAKLVEALAKPQESAIRLNLGAFGLKILPILRALDQELSLGLSLKEIEQQLEKRAQSESATA